MTLPTLSGQFVQVLITDSTGTLQDVSPYLKEVVPHRASVDADQSSFAPGGGPITANHQRGAAVYELTLKGYFNPTYCKILRQLYAARSGATILIKAGSNAVPGQGDELGSGTFTLCDSQLTYNTGADATLDANFKASDGGTVMTLYII